MHTIHMNREQNEQTLKLLLLCWTTTATYTYDCHVTVKHLLCDCNACSSTVKIVL